MSLAGSDRTLHGVLHERAQLLGDRSAYTFESADGDRTLSFRQLDRRARAIAARLQHVAVPGDRVLLLFPAGLDFITAFFGCLYAGIRAVPTTYPKPRRPMPRLTAIAHDCEAVAALTDVDTLSTIDESIKASGLPNLKWLSVEDIDDGEAEELKPVRVRSADLAFLQYTSGSTSDPKGVMVSHGNVLHNLEMIRQGFNLSPASSEGDTHTGVFWLPAYHDMGLIGGILESMYIGGHSVLISPAAFLQRPMGWLEDMSKYKAQVSGAPNFAYELCVTRSTEEQRQSLDLSHWRVAFCGAEPIRPETFQRFSKTFAVSGFRPDVFYPCYGLAEATLIAAGPDGPGPLHTVRVCRNALEKHKVLFQEDGYPLVTCGGPLLNQRIVIADPETCDALPADRVGEIWVKGESVTQGYWNKPEATNQTFGAYLTGDKDGPFMRTGDLGFLHEGQLAITGRVKDVMIIRGRNHYPQDIEHSVAEAHEAMRPDSGAVFTVEDGDSQRLVVIQEIFRQFRNANLDEVIRSIRREVSSVHELEVTDILLIRQMSLPKTTSGKPQRHLCREQFENNQLKIVAQWSRRAHDTGNTAPTVAKPDTIEKPDRPMTPDEIDRLSERIESWLLNWLMERAAIPREEIDRNKPFAEYGLDSMTAVELSQELWDWVGIEVVPTVAWNYPTPAALSRYLAQQAGGLGDEAEQPAETPETDDEFTQLLAEIESMSDEAAKELLED
jgi:acyl-CoA synthetase (AMP-forming)/AMP-acid ligase II/acyl carrier protein